MLPRELEPQGWLRKIDEVFEGLSLSRLKGCNERGKIVQLHLIMREGESCEYVLFKNELSGLKF